MSPFVVVGRNVTSADEGSNEFAPNGDSCKGARASYAYAELCGDHWLAVRFGENEEVWNRSMFFLEAQIDKGGKGIMNWNWFRWRYWATKLWLWRRLRSYEQEDR